MDWAYSRGSSPTRDQTHVSCVSCISRQILTTEPHRKLSFKLEREISWMGKEWEQFQTTDNQMVDKGYMYMFVCICVCTCKKSR